MGLRSLLRCTAATVVFSCLLCPSGFSYAIRVSLNNVRSGKEGAALAGLPVAQTDDQSTVDRRESSPHEFEIPKKDWKPSRIQDGAAKQTEDGAVLGLSEHSVSKHVQSISGGEDATVGQTAPVEDIPTLREDIAGWELSVDHFLLKKPRRDLTQYAAFRLHDMQLDGLAAYDKLQPTGAFAISVGCGYFHDPVAVPGVAHMVEHMIFLGSKNQPGATEWDEFVGANGGSHNAHTKPDMTTFYVQGPTVALPALLDAFLDHLFHPLFLEEQFESEVMAVQYEHEKNIPDVERVVLLLAMRYLPERGADSLVDRASTLSGKFGTGSLESLCNGPKKNNIDILKTLRAYHQKCYRPENMVISIRLGRPDVAGSSYSVQGAIQLAETAFRKYASKNTPDKGSTSFVEIPLPQEGRLRQALSNLQTDNEALKVAGHYRGSSEVDFKPRGGTVSSEAKSTKGTMIRVQRRNGWHDRAFIVWGQPANLDSSILEAEYSSMGIVDYLLDHPSGNGLIERLKDEGLINGAECFRHSTTRSNVWGLSFDLTSEGASQFGKIKSTVSNYVIKMKEKVTYDFIEQFYRTLVPLSRLSWDLQDPLSPLDQVVVTAEKLLQFPMRPDLLLTGDVVLSDPPIHIMWREVTNILNAMSPGSDVTVRVDPNNSFSYENFKKLEEYDVEYIIEEHLEVPEFVPRVNVPGNISCTVPSETVKPYPPPTVCFSMNPYESIITSQEGQRVTGVATTPPCVLLSDESVTLLWHNGAPFNKPIVRAFIKARIPESAATATSDVFGKAFSSILGHRARKKLARYHGCGVEIVVAYTAGAIVIEVESLSSMFPKIISDLGSVYEETLSSVTELEFTRAIEMLRAQMEDFSGSTSYEIAMDVALSFIRQSRYSQFDLLQQLKTSHLTFGQFKEFIEGDLTVNAIDMFTMGHIDASAARRIMMNFAQQISKKSVPYEKAAGTKILKITSDIDIDVRNPIPSDVNNAYVSLFVSEPPDALEAVVYQMIGEIIGAPFFDAVRTRKMDGYVASASVIDIPPVAALGTVVQSSTRTPEELEQHVCSFLYDMMGSVGKLMALSDFNQRARWTSKTKFARASNSFAAYFLGVVSQLSMRNFCFVLPELASIASDHFLQCPSSIQEYLQRLLMQQTRHRVTVKLSADKTAGAVVDAEEQTCKLSSDVKRTTLDFPQHQRRRPIRTVGRGSGSKTSKPPKKPITTFNTSSSRSPIIYREEGFVEVSSGTRIAHRSKAPEDSSGSNDSETINNPDGNVITVATSADVTDGPVARDVALGDSFESQEYCRNSAAAVTPSNAFTSKRFADDPSGERERLWRFLRDSSGWRRVDSFWIAYDHDSYCTIRESSIQTANACIQNGVQPSEGEEVSQESEWLKPTIDVGGEKVQSNAGSDSGREKGTQNVQSQNSSVDGGMSPPPLPGALNDKAMEREDRQTGGKNLQQRLLEHQHQQAEALLRLQRARGNGVDSQVPPASLIAPGNNAVTAVGFGRAGYSLRQQQRLMLPRLLAQRRYGMTPSLVMTRLTTKQTGGVSERRRMGPTVGSRHDAERITRLLQIEEFKLKLLKERRQALDNQIAEVMQQSVPLSSGGPPAKSQI